MTAANILDFWFKEITPQAWWKVDTAFDQLITERFGETLQQAIAGELVDWRAEPLGRLAEIIVLDQFSRNIYRGRAQSFQQDPQALILAQEAVAQNVMQSFSINQKQFLYMPYMHSESLKVHDSAVALFSEQGLENAFDFEMRHRDIIERFGRYPHRNKILGRESTAEELAFLQQPGSSF